MDDAMSYADDHVIATQAVVERTLQQGVMKHQMI